VPLIDSHVHLYPPELNRDPAGWAAARHEEHWALLSTRRRKDGRSVQGFPEVGGLLRAMDAAGVNRAVLLGWYWQRAESCAEQNRFYAECVRRYPDRLAACATLQPAAGRPAALAELHRAREEGLIGLGELSPHSQGYGIDDSVFREVLAQAGDLKLPVNLHVTGPDSRSYPGRVVTPPADFVRLAAEFSQTTFILAHWGGLLPLRDPAAKMPPNIYYDTAASPLLYGPEIWRRFTAAVGADRVLFGSDFPLNLYPGLEQEPEIVRLVTEVRSAGLSAESLAAVMHENATRVLRL
jgi:predicted TIM-barrel fold metal-dependent hydrolase